MTDWQRGHEANTFWVPAFVNWRDTLYIPHPKDIQVTSYSLPQLVFLDSDFLLDFLLILTDFDKFLRVTCFLPCTL